MKLQFRRYAWSFLVALAMTVLVGAVASLPRCAAVGILLGPGMLAAAIVFHEGIHSDWPQTYLLLAVLMNAFLLAWPVFWVWAWIGHSRRRG